MRRFIVNETFTDEDTGTEYFQGAIYELDAKTKAKVEQWAAEDKIRDPDVSQDDDDVEKTIDEAKAKHEAEEDDEDEEEEDEDEDADEKDEPA